VKTEENHSDAGRSGAARWLKNSKGGLSLWRSFLLLFLLMLSSAILVAAGGVGTGLGAVLMAILGATLVYALVLTPLAHDFEAVQTAQSPVVSSDTGRDQLSGIANRRSITAALLNAMAYANRYSHPLSVAMVDLDMLSEINSGLGRKAGDKAIQTVAGVFTDTLRMPDRAGRFGDEEFLVLLPNTTIKNGVKIAERIRTGVKGAQGGAGSRKIPLTVSIGVSQFRKGEDMERFLSRVNKALAQAKTGGRNRVATDK